MADRWRNVANNGYQGAVVRSRFLSTDSDGWLDGSIELTGDEAAKMALLGSWVVQDDPRIDVPAPKPSPTPEPPPPPLSPKTKPKQTEKSDAKPAEPAASKGEPVEAKPKKRGRGRPRKSKE